MSVVTQRLFRILGIAASFLAAGAASAAELPIKGEYGDQCGGRRSGHLASADKELWSKPMSARAFGIWGDTWGCEFIGYDELPREAAEQTTEAERARGWAVRSICQGLRPIETFLIYAYVDEKRQPVLMVRRGDEWGTTLTFGLCPVGSFLRPAK